MDKSVTLTEAEWKCLIQISGEALNKAFGQYVAAKSAFGENIVSVMAKIKQQVK